ncbi:maestro heat-like repeat-containing protein family member 7 [Lathamus discolor]|uniref:maestro heat-like repeat-containing protein family member 7 n=1 Tax=Lathamus discolor TaxID=678569 RepID=UPI0032B83C12
MEEEYTGHMKSIQAFLQSPAKEEAEKVEFLRAVSSLCRAPRDQGFLEKLKEFCEQYEVVENIKALVEDEPMEHLDTAVRQQAMLTLAQMSNVEMLLRSEKESLLNSCFRKVFFLPPITTRQGQDSFLYSKTLDAMDILLESFVLSSPGSRAVWRILQMLLPFTDIKHATVCERAVARIGKLADLMASSSSVQIWNLLGHDDSSSHHGIIGDRFLGQLLGCLIVCSTSKIWNIQKEAWDALQHLFGFIQQKKRTTSPEDDAEHPQGGGKRKAGKPSLLSVSSTRSIAQAFGEYLHPQDKTVIVLRAIGAMTDSCVCDKEELISILNVAMTEPASWLTEVPMVSSSIWKYLPDISGASARRSLNLLLLSMVEQNPREMILSLMAISPACDRVALAMWEELLSQPLILEKVLRELSSNLQQQQSPSTFRSHTVEACIQLLTLLASSDVTPEEFAGVYNTGSFPWCQRAGPFSLTLTGLFTLSQSPDTARKILVLLPELREALWSANTAIRMKALLIFRNVVGHLKKASSTALQLAEELLPLFDDVSRQVRELSICLFKEIVQMADWKHKQQMRKKVRKSLVPLVLHTSDEIESVAKASYEALCVAAKVLKWKQLSHRMRVLERERTVECLLEHDRSRAEEYVFQILPYLQHAQVTVRTAALRFIGLAGKHLENSSKDTLQEIYEALYNSSKDEESEVSSLAVQTMDMLRISWTRPRPRWTLWALCCCL